MKGKHYTLESFKQAYFSKYPNSTTKIIELLPNSYVRCESEYGIHISRRSHLLDKNNLTIQTAVDKLEYFKNYYLNKYSNSLIEFLEILPNENIKCKSKYGIHIVKRSTILNGSNLSIQSAINKNEYFINQAKEVHKDKYDYSSVKINSGKDYLNIICKKHGLFVQKAANHLQGCGCNNCFIDKHSINILDFIEKSNKIHGNKYDYSLVDYKDLSTKVKIICPTHSIFQQTPHIHIYGSGCRKCANLKISEVQSKLNNGWSHTVWEKKGKESKNFDSFKVYIIRCYNENEEFYKIGKTFQKVEKRFCNLPYQFKIFKIFEGDSLSISKLENELKNQNRKYKYLPQIKFDGMQECYKQLN